MQAYIFARAFQVECFKAGLANTKCGPTDIACLCADTQFLGGVQACQAKTCTVKEVLSKSGAIG